MSFFYNIISIIIIIIICIPVNGQEMPFRVEKNWEGTTDLIKMSTYVVGVVWEDGNSFTITNENLPQANRFAAQARALRELRDDMELDAYGLLQASAATRKEIDRLTVLLNEVKAEELDSYGWHLVWSVLK